MSLNHLKATAEQLEGGFEALDQMRLAALSALEGERPSTSSGHEPKGGADSFRRLRSDVARLSEELRITREDLALLQRAYDERCRQARRYAEKASKPVQAQCRKDQQALDQSLSLCRRLGTNHNVFSTGQ